MSVREQQPVFNQQLEQWQRDVLALKAQLIFRPLTIAYALAAFVSSPNNREAYYIALTANVFTDCIEFYWRLPSFQFSTSYLKQVIMALSWHYNLFSVQYLHEPSEPFLIFSVVLLAIYPELYGSREIAVLIYLIQLQILLRSRRHRLE